jgi:hypothetical protein
MATYRLAGAQNPADRIERWVVESPSDDFPDGKVLELDGVPVELTDDQYSIGSRFLRLEPVKSGDGDTEPPLVDQPGVALPSLSTDVPPDPGTLPDVEQMNNEQLRAEAERVGADVSGKRSNEDLKRAIQTKREEG